MFRARLGWDAGVGIGSTSFMRRPLLITATLLALAATVPADSARAGAVESVQTGVASFYASFFHGRKTANGERYDEGALTAAHRTLPFGTRVRVTNLDNQKTLLLRINDRGPFIGNRIIDLSRAAAHGLGFIQKGLARVKVEVLGVTGKIGLPEAALAALVAPAAKDTIEFVAADSVSTATVTQATVAPPPAAPTPAAAATR